MEQESKVRGGIAGIIRNDALLFEGDLKPYFRAIFYDAQNLLNPYHNGRHMLHVLWLCYQACIFYGTLSKREVRNAFIAAMFHDFNHTGKAGPDSVNIERAIAALKEHIMDEDREELPEIIEIIMATEFPYKTPSNQLNLTLQIIRDADLSQALDPVWLQQVVLGLAAEWGKTPCEILRMQDSFLGNLKFITEWAKKKFPEIDIESKIAEAKDLLALLEEEPAAAVI